MDFWAHGLDAKAGLADLQKDAPDINQLAPVTQDDLASRNAQQQALNGLQREIAMGGWSPDERTVYQHQMATANGVAAGQRAGLIQQMVARGMSPGLAASIANQAGQQQQATMGNQAGWAAEQAAQQRKQTAMGALAGLANQTQQQSTDLSESNASRGLQAGSNVLRGKLGESLDTQHQGDLAKQQAGQMIGYGGDALSNFASAWNSSNNSGNKSSSGSGSGDTKEGF